MHTENVNKKQSGLLPKPQRLLGSYPQKQQGLWMQRIPVFGGRIDIRQWRTIVRIAGRFSPSAPLHLTTRQDIELHDIAEADIPVVYQELNVAGMSTFGACGDCVRNITICSGCEFHDGAFDVWPLAKLVREVLFSRPMLFQLPRKFKISFSGCKTACARPFVNDLGFIALSDGNFRAIGAGSLGIHPELGVELYASLTPQEVVWFSAAALELFADLGDRENRRKARLRHVRQRLGDGEFSRELHRRFETIKQTLSVPELKLISAPHRLPHRTTLQCVTGEISLRDAEALAEYCEENHVVIRINLTHGIELYGDKQIVLSDVLRKYENMPCIVACPGNDTCTNGLTHTRRLAAQLAGHLAGMVLKDKTIAISGCPNRCAQCAVADIGLTGCMKTIDGERKEAYHVFSAGGNGKNAVLAVLYEIEAAEQIPQLIAQKWNTTKTKS